MRYETKIAVAESRIVGGCTGCDEHFDEAAMRNREHAVTIIDLGGTEHRLCDDCLAHHANAIMLAARSRATITAALDKCKTWRLTDEELKELLP